MNEYWKVALPAAIALLGTLITVVFGYRQWKRQQDATRYGIFLTERQAVYKELWQKLEEIHVRLRIDSIREATFQKLLREVNAYTLKQSLYLRERDRKLAQEYLLAINRLTVLVATSGDGEAEAAYHATGAIPHNVLLRLADLQNANDEVSRLRNSILSEFREIIAGPLAY